MVLSNIIEYLLSANNFTPNEDEVKSIIHQLKIMPNYPIILVGGTNGKGSVCAYLTAILTLAGYKVGSFTSPHVFCYSERIAINNSSIDNDTLKDALETVIAINKDLFGDTSNLGLFKTFTLAAHLIFIANKIDIAIIEVGIGGKSDVTNLFTPCISAITNVSYDHSNLLGDTLDQIGREKAGIFRSNKLGFFGSENIPTTVVNYAKKIGTKLQVFGQDFAIVKHELCFDILCQSRKFYSLPYPSLRGHCQAQNAALAVAILSELNDSFPLSITQIKTGLLQTRLIGRFQVMPGCPQNILDVAHNSEAVAHMLQNMLKLPFANDSYAVFGIAKDKDIKEIIHQCCRVFAKWFIAEIRSDRTATITDLTRTLIENGIESEQIIVSKDIREAYMKACSFAKSNDRIVSFGSFLVVEDVYKTIKS